MYVVEILCARLEPEIDLDLDWRQSVEKFVLLVFHFSNCLS